MVKLINESAVDSGKVLVVCESGVMRIPRGDVTRGSSSPPTSRSRGMDGLHPASRDNLMITYFFKFFEQPVHNGHVYVLETPFFRVRNKSDTLYFYSEAERDAALTELGGQPACVAEASSESKRAQSGQATAKSTIQRTTARQRPERKDYIMDSLVVPVEE